MRVIAGTARGIKLKAPRGETTRPTADRVKEALFSILGPKVIGAVVLDLFAGSGALGIEALSRGARHCTFVEISRRHLAVVRDNLCRTGFSGQARLLGLDAATALRLLSRERLRVDIIFLDPPYHSSLIPKALPAIAKLKLLREAGLVIVEHSAKSTKWAEEYPGCRQKKYGDTQLTLIGGEKLDAATAEKESRAYHPEDI